MKHFVVVDCYNVAAPHFFATPPLTNGFTRVEAVIGFLRDVRAMTRDLDPDAFVFCFDSASEYCLRRKMYPNYKKDRELTRDALTAGGPKDIKHLQAQVGNTLLTLLHVMGYKNIFADKGFEADDCIAKIVKSSEDQFTIVSRDSDLYQLLAKRVRMYSTKSKTFFYKKDFLEKYEGLLPEKWATVKAMAGCTSDSIKGIVGVGEKRAVAYLLKRMAPTVKVRNKIEMEWSLVEKNLKLTTLPLSGCLKAPIKLVKDGKINWEEANKVLNTQAFK